jgi:putative flavoprotein involved in K+ transport
MNGLAGPERFDTVIIGGGQAGLAVGYHLAQRDRTFVILEAGDRIGGSWRMRWDGLRLFTPARYDGLPGMRFPAASHSLPTKDDVADYLEAYAVRMNLPIRTRVLVTELTQADGDGFIVVAGRQRFEAREVVVATGAYRQPRIPDFARELGPSIQQLHSSAFHDPSELRDGGVLVVGASNSGAEIALMAARDHRTVLSGPDKGTMPMRPESRLARLFDPAFWFFINHMATTSTPFGRKALPIVRDHGGPLERVWPEDLAAAGVERVFARTVGVRDGLPLLDDGRVLDVANVIYCTGFRPDFGWIHLPVAGADGWPLQTRGVVRGVPGLYFVGLPFLYSAASALIGGVGRDARFIADRIAERTDRPMRERETRAAISTG